MTAVLHVSEGVWAARPPILPIEGQKCQRCGGQGWEAHFATKEAQQ